MPSQEQKSVSFSLPKQFNITMVDSIYHQLEPILSSASEITLDGVDVEKTDSTAIQLLVCLKKHTQKNNQTLKLINLPEIVSKTAKQLGLLQLIQS
ncbi:MAG: STAS domain-containing protein [Saccharospirillaceae bacterium]|nr:STAS domain-containing protein [Pseudomonadales bacterium]NRB80834.1 STAS domain-containing protein [Saccharospirillaceae bacterium]